jgi:zinc protease
LSNSKTSINSYLIPFKDFKLDNGLRVILSEDKTIHSVAINICYHVGSKNESKDNTGYAHLFEHLMFESSKNLKPGEYDKYSMLAGGENNAYTSEDKTNYYLLLPSNQLELGLWLESDRMLEFAISEESLNKQKDVVKEEKKYIIDNKPFGSVNYKLAPKLFKKSSYRWDPIGDMTHIENATLSDLKKFFDTYYTPSNTVLSIAGDIDINVTIKLIKKYFEQIPNNNIAPIYNFSEDEISEETIQYVKDNIQFPGIFIGYRIPKEGSEAFYNLNLLSEILAGGESSKLYNKLVYEMKIANDIDCYIDAREYTSVLLLSVILMPGIEVKQVRNVIDNIINSVLQGNISEREIDKAKNKLEARNTYRKQSILHKADMLAHYKMFYNNPDMINTNFNNYKDITKDDILYHALKYLQSKNRVILIYEPKDKTN